MHIKTAAARLTASLLLFSSLVVPSLAVTGTVNSGDSVLNLRSDSNTSSSVLCKLEHGTQVEITGITESGWYQIAHNGETGYASSDYISVAECADIPTIAEPMYGRITTSVLNVRSGPSTDTDKVGTLKVGQVVTILEQQDEWYRTEEGFISAEYVTLIDAAEAASSGRASELVALAMSMVGRPYVYGGSSPSGFDCSGFTSYICKQFGIHINRTASTQLDNGYSVSRDELQPGDLVMFRKGGSKKRASHVGIYIGNGQFVHSSTYGVGVIVSSMYESYYNSGFVGGRRVL